MHNAECRLHNDEILEIIGVLTPDQRKIAQELNLFGPNRGMGMGGPVK